MWRYAGIEYYDAVNGDGLGAVIFLQGCPHHCKGCHNPQTWDPNGGIKFDESVLDEMFKFFATVAYAYRLTISGGDPIANPEFTYYIASRFKQRFPHKELWLYTGYDYEYVARVFPYIVEICDFIVDGKFELDKRDITLQFRGSSNQRIIDVQKTLDAGKVIEYEQTKWY